jgi:hypothetical protein
VALASLCELWTPAQVSEALGGERLTLVKANESPQSCQYQAARRRSFTDFAALYSVSTETSFVYGDQTVETIHDLIQLNFPDAAEVDVVGLPALQTPTARMINEARGWRQSTLYVFPNDVTMLQMQVRAPRGVDPAAAVVSLAELAGPWLTNNVPAPSSPAPSSPAPSGAVPTSPAPSGLAPSPAARTGLAALFPADIGGSPVTVDVLTGREFLSQVVNFRPMEQRLTRALRQRGRRIGDLSFAQAQTPNGSAILAFQVKGGPIRPLVNVLLEALGMERTGEAVPPEAVAGKDVFEVLSGAEGYAYQKGDVLWLVFSFGDEQTEIFEKLP